MGDTADLMLDGILCEQCGVFIDEVGVGYPRNCGCEEESSSSDEPECFCCFLPVSECECEVP
jgi:hypothetical protein